MRMRRLLRHAAALHWRTRMLFPRSTLDAIQEAIERAERAHAGEIRFAVETALPPRRIIGEIDPRARALEVFSELRVWDTENNNGVLIYVLIADHSVEIVADRGLRARVASAEWEAVCRMMEEHFRAGRFKAGSIAGIDAVGGLLARHFPAAIPNQAPARNELPDQPTLL
ncbi:MAG: TPM domain-containing protein [Steroidobacteraceae bacterium]